MNLSQPTLTYKYNEDVSVGNFSNTNDSELCVCFSKYDLLEQYLINDVSGSHSCRRLLRAIDYIRRDIYVVDTWNEVIGNGYYITLENERAIIGLFNEDYLADHSPNSPVNIIPYQIFIPVLNTWMQICEQHESEYFKSHNPTDTFIGQCIYGVVITCGYEHIELEYESKKIFLHKSDLIWELHFQTCQNYVNIGDEIFVKIIDKRNDEFYIASMLASHPDYDPLLEPNLRCGAIWQSKVVYFKKKGKFIQYYVDIFPCCWGQFYEKTNRHILVNDIVNVRILDTKNIKSYSNYGYYCKADLQIVYDCNNIVNCYHPEIVPSIKINRLR